MSLAGVLSPARDWLAGLWITQGGRNMDLLAALSLPPSAGFFFGLAFAALALYLSRKERIGAARLVFASGVGFSVAVGWVLTYYAGAIGPLTPCKSKARPSPAPPPTR